MTIKKKFAVGTDHEFESELPFNSIKEMNKMRNEWRKLHFPDRNPKSTLYEFYLQYLPIGTTVDYIKSKKGWDLSYFILKYGESEGNKKYNNRIEKDKFKNTKENYILKYGEKDGLDKYYKKNKNLSVSYNTLKSNGRTDEEINLIRETHRKKSINTIDTFILRYGEFEGTRRWNEYINENHITPSMISYWIKKGFSEDESKKIISKLQKRDLPYFINKYGEKEGTDRYLAQNLKKVKNSTGISNIEKQIFLEILKTELCYNCYPIDKYVVDILIPSKNIIIEIQGDYWHCNPDIWKADDFNKTIKMTAKERWEKDEIRKKRLVELGYKVIYIWEKDIKNGSKLKNNYLDIINEKINSI